MSLIDSYSLIAECIRYAKIESYNCGKDNAVFGLKSKKEREIEDRISKRTGHQFGCRCQTCNIVAISENFEETSKLFRSMSLPKGWWK